MTATTPRDTILPVADTPVVDTPRAKICPECAKLMARRRVGRGVEFALDRCPACGGMWFDANEWETLARHGLRERVHLIFSSAWQAQLQRERQEQSARHRLAERIGEIDLAELDRVVAWIERHPHRRELTASLLQRVREHAATALRTNLPTAGGGS